MIDEAIQAAKEIYLTQSEDGQAAYSLNQGLDLVIAQFPKLRGRLTLSVLRSHSRSKGDADVYSWEELRILAKNLGVNPEMKALYPTSTWEEVIMEAKANLDRMGFNTNLQLNLEAAKYLGAVKLVGEPGNMDFIPPDFEEVDTVLSIYNKTKSNLERDTPERS